MLGLEGKMDKAKIKDNAKYCNQEKLVRGYAEAEGGQRGWRLGVAVRLSEGPGLPPAELSHGSSSPTAGTPGCRGSSGGG